MYKFANTLDNTHFRLYNYARWLNKPHDINNIIQEIKNNGKERH